MNRADYLERFAARLSRQIARSASTSSIGALAAEQSKSEIEEPRGAATPWANFNELALELFELQFESNLPYRRFCETRGCRPREIQSWHRIPAVPTVAFKELEFSCIPADERTTVFFSSGTTQAQPSRHFHNPTSARGVYRSITTWFKCQFGTGIRSHCVIAPYARPKPGAHEFLLSSGVPRMRCDGSWNSADSSSPVNLTPRVPGL